MGKPDDVLVDWLVHHPLIIVQFQIETEELDDFKDELRTWRTSGSIDNRPPPLIIDVYLDTSTLKENQSLVVLDDDGKRWDVMEQLNPSTTSAEGGSSASPKRNAEVLLERWRVELTALPGQPSDDFGPILPSVYKKAIVFFRSLFVAARILPAWKFAKQNSARNVHPALIPRCRVRQAEPSTQHPDPLRYPIDGRADPVTDYMFGDLEVPVGRLSTSVTYRNDCSFRIDDSESLLSSRFMGVDENFFKPSLPHKTEGSRPQRPDIHDLHQTYGSLSTFHGEVPMGTSPISALRAMKPAGSDTDSPPASLPVRASPEYANSLPVPGRPMADRPPVRPSEGSSRRPSVSFQPFKAGSLSASPGRRQTDAEPPASPQSLTRPGLPALQQPRTRTSLTAGMPASLRGGPPSSGSAGDAVLASSPKPASASASRYSSSFTHRRGRLSFGGASRGGDDEQGSSGRQSLASSVAQPGSGLLAETGGTSSGSLQTDDDNISEFLKALDSKKTLKSFEQTKRGESATNRTVAQLSKFHMMKESNNALTESMTSSVQMQRSSSSSSRQLTSVPGMVAPASMSASSSPGKPLSPHTPHTPAIPSRLSENSIVNYSPGHGRADAREGRSSGLAPSRQDTITQEGTATAIDIPLSPRLGSYQRRSSSVAQQSRNDGDEDDGELAFARCSISLGAEDREPPTISSLLGHHLQLEEESTVRESSGSSLQPAAEIQKREPKEVTGHGSSEHDPPEGFLAASPSSSPFGRKRYTGLAGRQRPTPHSSRGSFTGSGSRQGRDEDSVGEEPLVFNISEMDTQGRRSIEESRGSTSSTSAPGNTGRGSSEQKGVSRRGW